MIYAYLHKSLELAQFLDLYFAYNFQKADVICHFSQKSRIPLSQYEKL